MNSLRENGESLEQEIEVTVNGELVSQTDYTVSKNVHISAGNYVLKVTFNSEIDSEKPYANLAEKSYYKEYSIASANSGGDIYDVTVVPAEHGTVTVDKKYVTYGGSVTIKATPDEGYVIDKILVNGKEVTNLTIKNIKKDTKIEVTFKEIAKIDKTDVSEMVKSLKIRANTEYTKLNGKIATKVKVTVISGNSTIQELKDAGYTVKYEYYRSINKKTEFRKMFTKSGKQYWNTFGTKGEMYYYRVQLKVYDENGKLAAKTRLNQCYYGNHVFKG